MPFLKRLGVTLLWIIAAMVLIPVGGFLLQAAGQVVAAVVFVLAGVCWLVNQIIWQNNIVAGVTFIAAVTAGFAVWLIHN